MEQILEDIQQRLNDKVPALKYIDEDWGQLDYYSPNYPVKWPCALIDITDVNWSDTGKLIQLGVVQVKVRIADMKLSNSSMAAPTNQKEKAFAIFSMMNEVYKSIHGWSGSASYTKLVRTRSGRVRRDDGVRIYEMTFTTEFKDTSAAPQMMRFSPDIQIQT